MMATNELAIQVKGLTKIFKGKKAVDHVDLTIQKGEVFAILVRTVQARQRQYA